MKSTDLLSAMSSTLVEMEKLSKFDTFIGFVRQYDWTSAVAR